MKKKCAYGSRGVGPLFARPHLSSSRQNTSTEAYQAAAKERRQTRKLNLISLKRSIAEEKRKAKRTP